MADNKTPAAIVADARKMGYSSAADVEKALVADEINALAAIRMIRAFDAIAGDAKGGDLRVKRNNADTGYSISSPSWEKAYSTAKEKAYSWTLQLPDGPGPALFGQATANKDGSVTFPKGSDVATIVRSLFPTT